jgi:hypothetical protein
LYGDEDADRYENTESPCKKEIWWTTAVTDEKATN